MRPSASGLPGRQQACTHPRAWSARLGRTCDRGRPSDCRTAHKFALSAKPTVGLHMRGDNQHLNRRRMMTKKQLEKIVQRRDDGSMGSCDKGVVDKSHHGQLERSAFE